MSEYLLSRTIKQYDSFRQIEMINSNNYRCQFGVYSFIAGLYSPTKEYSFTDEIRWQPIISRQANFQGKVGYSLFSKH
ncbi:UNVERIFIED_CONTAM: hypothetical protein NCL1_09432 [Trichonephila clavipes]